MGFSLSWIAVKNSTPEAVCDRLSLRVTGERGNPDSPLSAASLPGGWYLVISDHDEQRLTDPKTLAGLSTLGEVVACYVEEHVMISSAELWRDGQRVWTVNHDAQTGMDHLSAEGNLPPQFAEIRASLQAAQKADGGNKSEVDHIFEIPVELAFSITGYRYDSFPTGVSDDDFVGLESTKAAAPRKSWLKRIFGR